MKVLHVVRRYAIFVIKRGNCAVNDLEGEDQNPSVVKACSGVCWTTGVFFHAKSWLVGSRIDSQPA